MHFLEQHIMAHSSCENLLGNDGFRWSFWFGTVHDLMSCSACNRLLEALTSQLSEMEKAALQNMKGTTLLVPEPYHFLLPEPRGLVTIVYPAGVPDSQLEGHRKVPLSIHSRWSVGQRYAIQYHNHWTNSIALACHFVILEYWVLLVCIFWTCHWKSSCQQEFHGRFDLPEDRPYFRKANAFRFPDQVHKDGYLRNPHQVLTHPNLDNGKVRLCITCSLRGEATLAHDVDLAWLGVYNIIVYYYYYIVTILPYYI